VGLEWELGELAVNAVLQYAAAGLYATIVSVPLLRRSWRGRSLKLVVSSVAVGAGTLGTVNALFLLAGVLVEQSASSASFQRFAAPVFLALQGVVLLGVGFRAYRAASRRQARPRVTGALSAALMVPFIAVSMTLSEAISACVLERTILSGDTGCL
jgi:hypothetical protein